MNQTLVLSLTSIGVAVLMAGLSIPMILRRIPMNSFYGARFKASFKSKKNWYEINEYGGKALLAASLLIAIPVASNENDTETQETFLGILLGCVK